MPPPSDICAVNPSAPVRRKSYLKAMQSYAMSLCASMHIAIAFRPYSNHISAGAVTRPSRPRRSRCRSPSPLALVSQWHVRLPIDARVQCRVLRNAVPSNPLDQSPCTASRASATRHQIHFSFRQLSCWGLFFYGSCGVYGARTRYCGRSDGAPQQDEVPALQQRSGSSSGQGYGTRVLVYSSLS